MNKTEETSDKALLSSQNVQLDMDQSQASAHPRSRYAKEWTQIYPQKQRNHFQASAVVSTNNSGYHQKERMRYQKPKTYRPEYVQGHFQDFANGPRHPSEQVNYLNHQVNDLRNRLQKKNNFLSQEKEKRVAAENDCNLQREKLKDVEKNLEDERHLSQDLMLQVQDLKIQLQEKDNPLTLEKEKRTASEHEYNLKVEQLQEVENLLKDEYHQRKTIEKELKWSRRTVDDLRQSSKASEARVREAESKSAEALKELEDLKKQLQDKTSSNTELTTKLRAQEEAMEELERKVAELTVQITSATEALKQKSEIPADVSESSGAEVSELKSISTQTETLMSEDISDSKTVSTQTETLTSEEVSESKTVSTQTETLTSEEVSESKTVHTQTETLTSEEVSESKTVSTQTETLTSEEVSEKKTTTTQTDTFPSEVVSESNEVCTQTDVAVIPPGPSFIAEVPHSEEASPSETNLKRQNKPSLWRCFKKCMTPTHRRKYKAERGIQSPQVAADVPKETEHLPVENTSVQEEVSVQTAVSGPEQNCQDKPSAWRRFKKCITPAHRRKYKSQAKN